MPITTLVTMKARLVTEHQEKTNQKEKALRQLMPVQLQMRRKKQSSKLSMMVTLLTTIKENRVSVKIETKETSQVEVQEKTELKKIKPP